MHHCTHFLLKTSSGIFASRRHPEALRGHWQMCMAYAGYRKTFRGWFRLSPSIDKKSLNQQAKLILYKKRILSNHDFHFSSSTIQFISNGLNQMNYFIFVYFVFLFVPSDIFSMISDTSGVMVYGRYDMFLREVLKLPTAVFEGPSFGYTEQSAKSCFSQQVEKMSFNPFSFFSFHSDMQFYVHCTFIF